MGNWKNWTGERLETTICNETMVEHLHRYAIAMELVKNKKVLDIACGEGYGSRMLAKNAKAVVAVDIDKVTISKAKEKYKINNIEFLIGSVEDIPANDNSFDVVVSFETLEHTSNHEKMITEIKRVLKQGGILIISTPDKNNYSDKTGYKNLFHKKELYEEEFKNLMKKFFLKTNFYTQTSFAGSLLMNEQQQPIQKIFTGDYENIEPVNSFPIMYHVAIASDNEVTNLSTSFFKYPKTISQIQYDEAESVKNTTTYRIGNVILFPFKFIRNLLGK